MPKEFEEVKTPLPFQEGCPQDGVGKWLLEHTTPGPSLTKEGSLTRKMHIYASTPLERRIWACLVSKSREYKHARFRGHMSAHKGAVQELLLHICLPSIALFGIR
jgi:hypothetical protein